MTKLNEILTHILENEPALADRECKPEFELVNLDNGGQEVRISLVGYVTQARRDIVGLQLTGDRK